MRAPRLARSARHAQSIDEDSDEQVGADSADVVLYLGAADVPTLRGLLDALDVLSPVRCGARCGEDGHLAAGSAFRIALPAACTAVTSVVPEPSRRESRREWSLAREPPGPFSVASRGVEGAEGSTTWLDVDGATLLLRRWRSGHGQAVPAGRSPVVVVHGFGEHSGRYAEMAAALSAAGHDVWAPDLPGHGRSAGPRAFPGGLEEVLAILAAVVDRAAAEGQGGDRRARLDGRRPVLLGHSMGGAFAAAYAVAHPGGAGSLVLSAPAVHLALRPGWQAAGLRALARLLPRAGTGRIRPELLSRDAGEVQAFVDDPLVWHGRVPASSALVMLDAGRRAFDGAPGVRIPVLLLQGADDAIVPPGSTRRLHAAIGSALKELVEVPGGRHELHHDLGREAVIDRVVTWLAQR